MQRKEGCHVVLCMLLTKRWEKEIVGVSVRKARSGRSITYLSVYLPAFMFPRCDRSACYYCLLLLMTDRVTRTIGWTNKCSCRSRKRRREEGRKKSRGREGVLLSFFITRTFFHFPTPHVPTLSHSHSHDRKGGRTSGACRVSFPLCNKEEMKFQTEPLEGRAIA